MSLLACFFSLLPGPQSSVQLVKPGASSFVAPSFSIRLARSFSDLIFFIYPLLLALALSCRPGPVYDFTNLLHREIIKRGQDYTISFKILRVKLVACLLLPFFNFFFWPSSGLILRITKLSPTSLTEIQVASRVIQRTIGSAPWISLKFKTNLKQ